MNRLQADLCLVTAAAVWGFAFIAQKTAMSHLDPLAFVALRGVVAVLALAPFAWFETRRRGSVGVSELMGLAPMAGLLFFLGAAFQQVGIVTASVTNTSFLTVLYTVFTPLIAWIVLRRQPSHIVWPAVALSCLGTWLLGGAGFDVFGRGEVLVIISAFFWAAHVVATGVSSRLDRPYTFNMLQFAMLAVLGFAAMAVMGVPLDWAAAKAAWIELLFVGVLSSALTFTLLTMALRHTPPAEAAVIVSAETVFAAAAAYVLLGERLTWLGWAGAATILAAALLVQLAPILELRRHSWRRGRAATEAPGTQDVAGQTPLPAPPATSATTTTSAATPASSIEVATREQSGTPPSGHALGSGGTGRIDTGCPPR
jgi:drug/metabolite transporter (DMT)-like permease